MRENYYIFHIRREVHHGIKGMAAVHHSDEVYALHKACGICRHADTKPGSQKMGILPPERVQVSLAFTHVGLDFTGPVFIKDYHNTTTRKAYILLFTCMSSRMVHLELTNDMSCEEFLSAFKRMINRRGRPATVVSDNQSTFKNADKVVQFSLSPQLKKMTDQNKVQKFLAKHRILWKFITERSPHRGGFYERFNRSLKEPLRKVLGNARLNYTELYSVLTDIEGVLNQRPLTYIGSDAEDLRPITPFHLATGRSLQSLPDVPATGTVTVSKRFTHLQTLLRHFWKRWSTEYLPTLITRKKWLQEEEVPKAGDVCLIMDEKVKRAGWPMGLVVKVFVGKDGLVRTYQLKTASGYLNRPINKLHLLEKGDPLVEDDNELLGSDSMLPINEEEDLDVVNDVVQPGEDVSNIDQKCTRYGRRIIPPILFNS